MARSKGRTTGEKVTAKSKYAFGSPEELSNRTKTGFQNPPTDFSQIAPAGSPGKNLNEPPHDVNSGHFKFSKGV